MRRLRVTSELCKLVLLLSLLGVLQLSFGLAQEKFPTGTYTAGEITLTFNDDGTHTVTLSGNVVVKGSYEVKHDQIVLTDTDGQLACDKTKPGKYRWKVDKKALKFDKIEDECTERAGALSGNSWEKK